jgi:NAD-dependent dihydropyrimidine dehydrogenase PreA subunit
MNHQYLPNVASLEYTPEKCRGCKRCVEVCPHGVFEMNHSHAQLVAPDSCMECGACALNCAFDAIIVRKGVGCASAMINGIITKGNPDLGTCDCSPDSGSCC